MNLKSPVKSSVIVVLRHHDWKNRNSTHYEDKIISQFYLVKIRQIVLNPRTHPFRALQSFPNGNFIIPYSPIV